MGGFYDYSAILVDGAPGDYSQVDAAKLDDLSRVIKNANLGAVSTSIIAQTGPCLLKGFTVSSVAAQFILFFDRATLPADTAVPTLSFPVAATSTIGWEWIQPRYCQNGIVLCASSTQHTKTITVAADTLFDVQYV